MVGHGTAHGGPWFDHCMAINMAWQAMVDRGASMSVHGMTHGWPWHDHG